MYFLLKQFVGALATPLAIALLVAATSMCFRTYGRRRLSNFLNFIALGIAYLGAISPVSNALLSPLEDRYPPFIESEPLPNISSIVVLGSGYSPRDGIPVTAALDPDGLARVVEGVRLALRFRNVRLVLSGGAPTGLTPSALGYAKLASDLGIPDSRLLVLDQSLDTEDEARTLGKLFGASPFLLVTSAYHMPRAMRLVEHAGARPIAVPTGQRTTNIQVPLWRKLIPNAVALGKTDRAFHEYLGMASLMVGLYGAE